MGTPTQELKALREKTGLSLSMCREALAAAGDLEGAMRWLVERGSLAEAPFSLHRALQEDDADALRRWLTSGGSPDEPVLGRRSLQVACSYGAARCAAVLLEHGAPARDAFQKEAWNARQVEALRVVAPKAPPPLLRSALELSLTHSALRFGTAAAVYLNERVGAPRAPSRAVALRAVYTGCTEIVSSWAEPRDLLDSAISESEFARLHLIERGPPPKTVRELAEVSLRSARAILAVSRELDREDGCAASGATREHEAAVERLEGLAAWLEASCPPTP
ncbi:MAG: hypothetical protein JNM74_13990 [Myxococcales bacterium]|nr:hypothetical protein [Myxococcales bacterium]